MARILAPLAARRFRLLWTGMAISLVGDGITLIALAWQVYTMQGTPAAMAGVGVAMSLPHVALLLAGGLVADRTDRRRVLLTADAVRGTALVVLGVLTIAGTLELWHVWLIAAVYGGGTAFFGPAFDAIVPDLVEEDLLPSANALDQMIRPLGLRLIGPAIGGVLVGAFGPGPAFLIDAATFGVSIVCLWLLGSTGRRLEPAGSPLQDLREGLLFVRHRRWIWVTLLAATISYLAFLGPVEVLLPYLVKVEMGGSATELGMVFAFGGVGAITAAAVVGSRSRPRRPMTAMYLAWTVSTLAVAGYGLASRSWQLAAVSFAFNAMESTGLILWMTVRQVLVPGRLLGRVSSLDWFISVGLMPLSFALAGPLAAVLGARQTLILAGVLGAVITFGFGLIPGVRSIEDTLPRDIREDALPRNETLARIQG